MTNIGIMQGRLLPPLYSQIQCFPRDKWEDEFMLAAQAKLDCIEWIYDLYGADVNPLSTDAGIEKMKGLSKSYNIKILSLCADYFMDKPLVRVTESELEQRLAELEWLIHRGQLIELTRIVLPFVDSSEIKNDAELDSVCTSLNRISKAAEMAKIEIHLETSLNPDRFAYLLSRLPRHQFKINYDSGNSSALGFHPREEFAAYGTRIGSVHIKDRIRGGGTVPLGMGDANFQELSEALNRIGYTGDFILQVARGRTGEEVSWAEHNREFVLQHFFIQNTKKAA